jgi:hypothetical protein
MENNSLLYPTLEINDNKILTTVSTLLIERE